MSKNTIARPYWLHCLSPLHIGAGQGAGYIDNPIMREKVTHWPFVPGSSIKGVVADQSGASDLEKREKDAAAAAAFGIAGDEGALSFSDASIVCLPVRSLYGTFAWCTAPLVLHRLQRDLRICAVGAGLGIPQLEVSGILLAEKSVLALQEKVVYLEDLDLTASDSTVEAQPWADRIARFIWPQDSFWHDAFIRRFAIVADEVFNFLCETATQVDTRVAIDHTTGIVKQGHLWTEEHLPVETLLAGVVTSTDRKSLDSYCSGSPSLQLGGLAGIGRGQVQCHFVDPASVDESEEQS